jgi:hypothetical protein
MLMPVWPYERKVVDRKKFYFRGSTGRWCCADPDTAAELYPLGYTCSLNTREFSTALFVKGGGLYTLGGK